jgi:hypothetical protein
MRSLNTGSKLAEMEITPGDSKQQRLLCAVALWHDTLLVVEHSELALGNSLAGETSTTAAEARPTKVSSKQRALCELVRITTELGEEVVCV